MRNCDGLLPKTCSQCNGVNLGTYCENLRTYCVTFCTNVEIKVCKAKAFHWLIQFQTISALMLRISKCRGLRIFWRNFLCLRNCGPVICLANIKSARRQIYTKFTTISTIIHSQRGYFQNETMPFRGHTGWQKVCKGKKGLRRKDGIGGIF